jgi:hypothetical protein
VAAKWNLLGSFETLRSRPASLQRLSQAWSKEDWIFFFFFFLRRLPR